MHGFLSLFAFQREYLYLLTTYVDFCFYSYISLVGYALLSYVRATRIQLACGVALICGGLVVVSFVRARFARRHQLLTRSAQIILVLLGIAAILYTALYISPSKSSLMQIAITLVGLVYIMTTIASIMLTVGFFNRLIIRWYKLVDFCIGTTLLFVLGVLSITIVPSMIQTRLMFHNAFSRGVLIDKLLRKAEESSKDAPVNTSSEPSVHSAPSTTAKPMVVPGDSSLPDSQNTSPVSASGTRMLAASSSTGNLANIHSIPNAPIQPFITLEKTPTLSLAMSRVTKTPSFNTLSKLAEGRDEDSFSSPRVSKGTLGTTALSKSDNEIAVGQIDEPRSIPPTVYAPSSGDERPIPRTVSVQEAAAVAAAKATQSPLPEDSSSSPSGRQSPESGGFVARRAAALNTVDEKEKEKGRRISGSEIGASKSVGLGLGIGLVPRRG